MFRIILLFVLIGFYTTSNAQNSELLKGKWVFKEALNKGIDKDGKKSLNSYIINKMTFEFEENGDFVAFVMGQNQKGQWKLTDNSKDIILDTGAEEFEMSILELTATRLVLKLGLGEFLMKKM
ncbi:lipocalin family protein [Flavobacterium sp. K5-23]|uniref:lipocalin family protein n=1 Tax=Flavobacterium sp. K5-23 TaxID=2746225 RepID=UPI00200E3A5B|nr:lipocalin family protein [Flavobacterium sp. K5-23]UQD56957.1 hypothetical protein FLAK523_11405 [Flavobacterium sp. K5-23]